MPRFNRNKLLELVKTVKEEGISTDGDIIRCNTCETVVTLDKKHQKTRLKQHIQSAKHQKSNLLKKSTKQSFIVEAFKTADKKPANEFFWETAAAFIQAGIPLQKINNPSLKAYLEKYMKRSIPDESTLRKEYIEDIYKIAFRNVIDTIGDNPVYFVIDETTDVLNRYVLNILVAPLTGNPTKPMLFKMYFLEKTNNTTIMQSFNDACAILWPKGITYEKVWLVVTDQASYMLLAFRNLKMLYPNLQHVTCLAHALHRVCEAVKDKYSLANMFLSAMKKVLVKCPSRQQLYKEITMLPLPPLTVVTRWGTWINTAAFLSERYSKISSFVKILDNESKAIEVAKSLVNNPMLNDELFAVHQFKFLCDAILLLEQQGLPKEEQWNIMLTVKDKLDTFTKEKLERSLGKNPDIYEFAYNKEMEHRLKTKFAPLVSVDVERSFSTYKYLLGEKQHNFKERNIEMINFVCYNKHLVFPNND